MELFLRSVALALLAVVLGLLLCERNQVFGTLLSVTACCMALLALEQLLQPVIELLEELRQLANMSTEVFSIVMKVTGISLIAQLARLVCDDAGQKAMGKVIGLLSNGAILWVSIPLVRTLLASIQEVLGRL